MYKLSVTVDEEVARALKRKVAPRGVSQFVNDAIRHELERERLRELLHELDERLGPRDLELERWAEAVFDRAEASVTRASKKRRRTRR